jgi:hypothetical protein
MPLPADFPLPEVDEEILREEMESLADAQADVAAGRVDVARASELRGEYPGDIIGANLVSREKNGETLYPNIAIKVSSPALGGSTTVWLPTSLKTAKGTAWQTERNLSMFKGLLRDDFDKVTLPPIGPNTSFRQKAEYYQALCDAVIGKPVVLRCFDEADREKVDELGQPVKYAKQSLRLRSA